MDNSLTNPKVVDFSIVTAAQFERGPSDVSMSNSVLQSNSVMQPVNQSNFGRTSVIDIHVPNHSQADPDAHAQK